MRTLRMSIWYGFSAYVTESRKGNRVYWLRPLVAPEQRLPKKSANQGPGRSLLRKAAWIALVLDSVPRRRGDHVDR
jgi:hypothetical protein